MMTRPAWFDSRGLYDRGEGRHADTDDAASVSSAVLDRTAYMLIGSTLLSAGFLLGLVFDRMVVWMWP